LEDKRVKDEALAKRENKIIAKKQARLALELKARRDVEQDIVARASKVAKEEMLRIAGETAEQARKEVNLMAKKLATEVA